MLKQTINYTDYNGRPASEEIYFNLTKAEVAKWELENHTISVDGTSTTGGISEVMQAVIDTRSGKKIMELFESIVSKAYGIKSEDGKRFMKSDQIYHEFTQTAVYDEFFFQLVTDADYAQKWVRGIMAFNVDKPAAPFNPNRDRQSQEVVDSPLPVRNPGEALSTINDAPKSVREMNEEELRAALLANGIE